MAPPPPPKVKMVKKLKQQSIKTLQGSILQHSKNSFHVASREFKDDL
jgi:hypothetical protein